MGIKPDPIPNPNYCPNTPWPQLYLPDYVIATIEGVEKSALWSPPDNEPPNGVHQLDFVNCNYYEKVYDQYDWMSFTFTLAEMTFQAVSGSYAGSVYGKGDIADPFEADNQYTGAPFHYQGGSVSVQCFFQGWYNPPDWFVGGLMGIQTNLDYFAENKNPGSDPEFVRYSSHKTGSVLHTKGKY